MPNLLPPFEVVECLLKNRAFVIKKPVEKRGQLTWSKYGGCAMAWDEAVRRSGFS